MNKTGTSFAKTGYKFSIEKLEAAYLGNLEELVEILAGFIITLCNECTYLGIIV